MANSPVPTVEKILVVELWNIGDVVLLMPFLSRLRDLFPSAMITLLARPHAKEILHGTGLADDFIEGFEPTDNWLSLNPLETGWHDFLKLRKQLRQRDFDLAFQCRLHLREHVILGLSAARRRIGYAFGDLSGLLTDAIPVGEAHRHKTADWLRLLEPFGLSADPRPPRLNVSEAEKRRAVEYMAALGIDAGVVVVGIHPGASVVAKRWPIERFAEVAGMFAAEPDVRVLAFVDPSGYGASLAQLAGVAVARVGLRELIALISCCDLLVCNDSGPMHIAGALGVPAVALFGSGVEKAFGPLGTGHVIVSADEGLARIANRHPGEPEAVSSIPVSRVQDAVRLVLQSRLESSSGAQQRC